MVGCDLCPLPLPVFKLGNEVAGSVPHLRVRPCIEVAVPRRREAVDRHEHITDLNARVDVGVVLTVDAQVVPVFPWLRTEVTDGCVSTGASSRGDGCSVRVVGPPVGA